SCLYSLVERQPCESTKPAKIFLDFQRAPADSITRVGHGSFRAEGCNALCSSIIPVGIRLYQQRREHVQCGALVTDSFCRVSIRRSAVQPNREDGTVFPGLTFASSVAWIRLLLKSEFGTGFPSGHPFATDGHPHIESEIEANLP